MNQEINNQDPNAKPDPFDPASLRIPQDFLSTAGVKKVLTRIQVRKPDRTWFIRLHPDWELSTAVLELKEERETYIVHPELRAEISQELKPAALYLGVTRQETYFVWPIPLPGPDGKQNEWHASALLAVRRAKEAWIRVVPNQQARGYDVLEALATFPEHKWPDLSMRDIIKLAFQDKLIDSLDHPVLRRLRGEI